jgi:8-oxo-dGTP pyrophosphatase MutT (NUDIX family)
MRPPGTTLEPRLAAVLILGYPKGGAPHVVFTKRTEKVADHRGQISLPGGSWEPGDPTLEVTALRETQEEIGVPMDHVQVVGRLSEVYVSVSNFLVTPYVGALQREPVFEPDPFEVDHLIEVPLAQIRDPSTFHEEDWVVGGARRRVEFYQCGPYQIWGATARILQLFLESRYGDALMRTED